MRASPSQLHSPALQLPHQPKPPPSTLYTLHPEKLALAAQNCSPKALSPRMPDFR